MLYSRYEFTKFGWAYFIMYTQIRILPGCVFGRALADIVDHKNQNCGQRASSPDPIQVLKKVQALPRICRCSLAAGAHFDFECTGIHSKVVNCNCHGLAARAGPGPTAACCADRGETLALARANGTMTGSAPASAGRTRVGPCQTRPAARRGRWQRHGLLSGRARRRSNVVPRTDSADSAGHGPLSRPRPTGSSRVRSADPVTQVGPGLLSGRRRRRSDVVPRADPVGAVGHGPRSKPRPSGSSRVRSQTRSLSLDRVC